MKKLDVWSQKNNNNKPTVLYLNLISVQLNEGFPLLINHLNAFLIFQDNQSEKLQRTFCMAGVAHDSMYVPVVSYITQDKDKLSFLNSL